MKKFALIGTSCVGKTTLQSELVNILTRKFPTRITVPAPEAARQYFLSHRVRNRFSLYHQGRIQKLARSTEQQLQMHADIVIADRSVLDAVAYIYTIEGNESAQALMDRVKKWLKTYTHLFLLDPNGIEYTLDSVRNEDKGLRDKFHHGFLSVLPPQPAPWTLISGKREERIDKMMEIIYRHI